MSSTSASIPLRGKPSATDTKLKQAISRLNVPKERAFALNDLCSLVSSNLHSRIALAEFVLNTNGLFDLLKQQAKALYTCAKNQRMEVDMLRESSNLFTMLKFLLHNQRLRFEIANSPILPWLIKSYIIILKWRDSFQCTDMAEFLLSAFQFILADLKCSFNMPGDQRGVTEHTQLLKHLIKECDLWDLLLPSFAYCNCQLVENSCEIIKFICKSRYGEDCNEKIVYILDAMTLFLSMIPMDEQGKVVGGMEFSAAILQLAHTLYEIVVDDKLSQLIIREKGLPWLLQQSSLQVSVEGGSKVKSLISLIYGEGDGLVSAAQLQEPFPHMMCESAVVGDDVGPAGHMSLPTAAAAGKSHPLGSVDGLYAMASSDYMPRATGVPILPLVSSPLLQSPLPAPRPYLLYNAVQRSLQNAVTNRPVPRAGYIAAMPVLPSRHNDLFEVDSNCTQTS